MNPPPPTGRPASGRVLLSAAAAVLLASCARPATDGGPAAAPDPSDLFRDVCGRIGDPQEVLVRAIETRGLRRARAADLPRPLRSASGRVWADRRTGDEVFVALERRRMVCTVVARRADVGLALRRFSEHVLGQAGPDQTVARAAEDDMADDGGPVRAGFRVTPRPTGFPPLAYAFLYTFSGNPLAATDAQLILRARDAATRP